MPGAKQWCFTINNYTADDESLLRARAPDIVYMVYGRERGESNTPHLQGFVQLAKRYTLASIRKLLSTTAHFEITRGTPTQAANYCKKDGDYEEFGELRGGQGRRSDLAEVANLVKRGASTRAIAEEHPEAFIRYSNGINKLRLLCRPKTRETPPSIYVYWGRTGLGKTRRVHDTEPAEELWIHPGGPWFDGYDNHDAVLFDDFDGGWFKLGYLLKLLDRYNFQVPIKGGHTWWCPRRIYITSNIDPRQWYTNASQAQVDALLRRFSEFGEIHHYDNPFNL